VWDAITSCNFFISGRLDNERFGVDWQTKWDGLQDEYSFGANLTEAQKKELVNKVEPGVEKKKYDDAKDILQFKGKKKSGAASLGVIRLDYDYPPAPGDIDCPESYGYDVFYRVIPGLTFDMCQSGKLTPGVEAEFVEGVKYLTSKGVSGITGDCGFMMWMQKMAREHTKKPVALSSLCQLPSLTTAFANKPWELLQLRGMVGAAEKTSHAI